MPSGKERRMERCGNGKVGRWSEREREECFKDEKMKKQKSRRRMGNKVVVVVGGKKRKP